MKRLQSYGGLNQAYSRLSTTHGHISDCKLDSVMCKVMGYDIMDTDETDF